MKFEVYIENYRADVTEDASALLTISLDDIKDFSERETSWSKTIILPGTANNDKLFGHIFEVGQSNAYDPSLPNIAYNFNAAKAADCIIFQDNIQSFKGVLRLRQINIDKGVKEYEVFVLGELAGLNVALSSGLLEQLDFSEYNDVFNATNVIASWDNAPGSGIYYPLIDYGTYSTDKHSWDIRTFRPAIYLKEVIDKMFAAAGYRYSSALFVTDRFKRLVIPHNRKNYFKQDGELLNVLSTGQTISGGSQFAIFANHITLGSFTTSDNINFTYTGPVTYQTAVRFYLEVIYNCTKSVAAIFGINGLNVGSATLPATTGLSPGVFEFAWNYTIEPGDTVHVYIYSSASLFVNILNGSSLRIEAISTEAVQINPGDTTDINFNLPKNVRQIDILLGIVKLFNLYVYEDRFDQRLINITPYVDFYSTESSGCVDWSYKLNRDKPIKLKPLSQVNAKIYEFKFKPDSDYYNDLYKKRYGQGYGDYIFDSAFEFAEQKNAFEIVFSATPLVGYSLVDKVYPTIFKQTGSAPSVVEERTDSNIRLLQSKKITGVSSWNIKDGETTLSTVTNYGYAGHLDDPDAPLNDLNFGALNEIFFTLTGGNLSNTQFNVYWSAYMADLTDKDSKLLTGNFYLQPRDIFNLYFSRFVMVDGVLFRLNKIIDYNMSQADDCKVELLKLQNLIY